MFDYFCERTPRSFVETRETSLVWNYKYADPDFGMIQARDLLQHLVTGPISNSPVDVVQGSRSVEVRAPTRHTEHCDAKVANRTVRVGEERPFRDARRFPSPRL